MMGRSAGKSRQMGIPLGTDTLAVLAQPIARGVCKTYVLLFGKTRFRKTSDVHPGLTGFSKTYVEARILKKKKLLLFLIFSER